MPKQRENLELIEVFAPDDTSVWSATPLTDTGFGEPPATPRQSRRGVAIIGVLVVAAFAASTIVFSDDSNSDPAVVSTLANTPTTQRVPLEPARSTHFLLDYAALNAYSADIVTPPRIGQQVLVYTDGSAVGPIVVIELHAHAYDAYGIVGGTRDVVEGLEVVRSPTRCPQAGSPASEPCDKLTTEAALSDSSVTVTGTSLSEVEFTQAVRSVNVVNGALAVDSEAMNALRLAPTFAGTTKDELIFGRVESAVRYLTADGKVVVLRSAVGDADQRSAALRYLTVDVRPNFYGRTYGYLADTGEAFVAWEEAGRLLSLVGPGDAGELSVISRQVRAATDDEWSAMVYGLRPDYTLGDFATLATGDASNNESWSAGPQIVTRNGRTEYLWWWTVPGLTNVTDSTPSSASVGTQPHFDTLVVPGATFVFVSQPFSGGSVVVRTSEGAEYAAELRLPFPDQSPVSMAVVRVEEPGPVSVEIDGVAVPV